MYCKSSILYAVIYSKCIKILYICIFLWFQFIEEILLRSISPSNAYVSYYRWNVAYRIVAQGKLLTHHRQQDVCDIHCRIEEVDRRIKTVHWVNCDACSRWVHTYCGECDKDTKQYMCPFCSPNEKT